MGKCIEEVSQLEELKNTKLDMFHRNSTLRSFLCVVILVISVLLVFRDILCLPYVGDDWAILHKMAFRTPREILLLSIDPSLLQIRPLQYLYTWALYAISGSYSSIFHIPIIMAHCCNALIIIYIMRKLLKSAAIAWTIGFLYAIAINIHLAPNIWLVGSSDVYGPLFLYASFALLLNRRRALSAICFLISLLFKEFAIAMLAFMFFYVFYENWAGNTIFRSFKAAVGRLWIHIVMAIPFLLYKMCYLPSPLHFPTDHPYKLSISGPHVFHNGIIYTVWLFQTILPFDISHPKRLYRWFFSGSPISIVVAVAALLLLITLIVIIIRNLKKPNSSFYWGKPSVFLLLGIWVVMGIAPVYFLPNHVEPYYMTYSFPACLAIILLMAKAIARWLGLNRKQMIGIAAIVLCLQLAWFSFCTQRSDSIGYYMIRGAGQVVAVHNYLMDKYPSVPQNTVFVLDGDKYTLWALRNDKAIQLWYRNRTIKVFDRRHITYNDGKILALRPSSGLRYSGSQIREKSVVIDPIKLISLHIDNKLRIKKVTISRME